MTRIVSYFQIMQNARMQKVRAYSKTNTSAWVIFVTVSRPVTCWSCSYSFAVTKIVILFCRQMTRIRLADRTMTSVSNAIWIVATISILMCVRFIVVIGGFNNNNTYVKKTNIMSLKASVGVLPLIEPAEFHIQLSRRECFYRTIHHSLWRYGHRIHTFVHS